MTYQEIAADLGISVSTIRTHLHNLYPKLGVVDRAQAVLSAAQRGWIELPTQSDVLDWAPPRLTPKAAEETERPRGLVLSEDEVVLVRGVLQDDWQAQANAIEAAVERALDDPALRARHMADAKINVSRLRLVAALLKRLEKHTESGQAKAA